MSQTAIKTFQRAIKFLPTCGLYIVRRPDGRHAHYTPAELTGMPCSDDTRKILHQLVARASRRPGCWIKYPNGQPRPAGEKLAG